ncbi:hypothetical protein E4U30_008332 [Claviceps sp. LM220 group G6]|nr:hypothetical protein E4U30_008332 [Claviceps sp. LM220 group G6]KAG6115383.1 hypothetical protein E4U14_000891 [Claviceps sp. LM454 group G7]
MRRKPTPQPLTLGGSASNASSDAGRGKNEGKKEGKKGGRNASTNTSASIHGEAARTTATARSEARFHPRSHISQQSLPSQQSLFAPPALRSSPALADRPAATGRRPHTAQAATGVPHSQTPALYASHPFQSSQTSPTSLCGRPLTSSQQLHRLRQPLHEQSRDDTTLDYYPLSSPSPYHGQTPVPASPASPAPPPPRHAAAPEGRRPGTKSGFFHFNKSSSKGSGQLHFLTSSRPGSRQRAFSGHPDGSSAPKSGGPSHEQRSLPKPAPPFSSRSELSLPSTRNYDTTFVPPATSKRSKSKSFALLSRSKSNRDRDRGHVQAASTSTPLLPPPFRNDFHGSSSAPLRTAPIAQDRGFRDMMNSNSSARNRSEDRAAGRDSSRDKERGALPATLKDNSGSNFLSGLRHSSTKAADIISKGLFGKGSRSGSTSMAEREAALDDEHYVLKVINLPLVEQTRRTRISKRLENSRDKTEFWMPAFPWRAIDYLNYKGTDVEGLYRVPGSGPQIKKWQRKFDEQYDVNLFEEDSLYDINIIGSMLKAWLRELPDELFPKEAQDRIARECAGATEVPQMLVDELANLSPFNYYLLFAITCHLSLLLAHSEKNKMDFRNLCICFQPCMKIDAFCFRFLVCDWRNCWKGCRNEAKYIEEEYRLFDQPPPRGIAQPNRPARHEESDMRHPRSPESSKPSNFGHDTGFRRQRRPSASNASIRSKASSISTNVTADSEHVTPERVRDMRPLSPIKPLSPIGF